MMKLTYTLVVGTVLTTCFLFLIQSAGVRSTQPIAQADGKQLAEEIAVRAMKDALKNLVNDLERKAYWLDLIESLQLFVSVSLDEQFMNVVKSGSRSPNRVVSILYKQIENASAKWLLSESDRYTTHLKKNGFANIELCLIQADIRCKDLYDKKVPELSRGLIDDSDLLIQVQAAGNIEGDVKKLILKRNEKREQKSVLCFVLLLPSSNRDRHLFTSTICITFYCTREDRSYLKRLQFDLFLDDLKPRRVDQFHYSWKIEKQKSDSLD